VPAAPDTLRAAAARLDHQAAWLPAALEPVALATGPVVWRGPAADRFATDLAAQRARLRSVADDLHATAARLRAAADRADTVGLGPVKRAI
jgi:hypothetical protein